MVDGLRRVCQWHGVCERRALIYGAPYGRRAPSAAVVARPFSDLQRFLATIAAIEEARCRISAPPTPASHPSPPAPAFGPAAAPKKKKQKDITLQKLFGSHERFRRLCARVVRSVAMKCELSRIQLASAERLLATDMSSDAQLARLMV